MRALLILVMVGAAATIACADTERSFKIEEDRFVKDGKPLQIISGSVHYHRIHPAYWKDRLQRLLSMGLNTVEFYVPWNWHEQFPGQYNFEGWADIGRFLELCGDLGLNVLLRPGPYICGEWNFGGFPWWLAASQVAGGRTMKLRVSDPDYLAHVERWWSVLLPKLAPYLYHRGGPILMTQVENEYGFCNDDHEYMRALVKIARRYLGPEALLFTTDPPNVVTRGSLPGDEIFTVVDFGPGTDVNYAFAEQQKYNPPGKSPALCSEYYTGWLSHWGEVMANTSTPVLVKTLTDILAFNNGTGSVNFYMGHGGTNFGNWAGANLAGTIYQPHITSYDYDCPVSEAGSEGQPGIGGENKYQILRDVITKHTGVTAPEPLPPPAVKDYGSVDLEESVSLLSALDGLYSGDGIIADKPDIMEEYGQMGGVIVYRTTLPAGALSKDSVLDIGAAVHDYAKVLVNGKLDGLLERNDPRNLTLGALSGDAANAEATLDIVVEALGRVNFGCPSWDLKGLQSKDIRLDGKVLEDWRVFPLLLDDLSLIPFAGGASGAASNAGRSLKDARPLVGAPDPKDDGPVFYRGTLTIEEGTLGAADHLPDTFLSTAEGFRKGIAFINGFNLGWYWPAVGPQMTLYIPGPLLREGDNEVVLLETEGAPDTPSVTFVDTPDFFGPRKQLGGAPAFEPVQPTPFNLTALLPSTSFLASDGLQSAVEQLHTGPVN